MSDSAASSATTKQTTSNTSKVAEKYAISGRKAATSNRKVFPSTVRNSNGPGAGASAPCPPHTAISPEFSAGAASPVRAA